jgi:hypothetical protein
VTLRHLRVKKDGPAREGSESLARSRLE